MRFLPLLKPVASVAVLAAGLTLTLGSTAHATTYVGEIDGLLAFSGNGSLLSNSTSFSFPTFLTASGTGEFSGVGFGPATASTINLSALAGTTQTFDTSADYGTFTASAGSYTFVGTGTPGTSETLTIKLVGTFTADGSSVLPNAPFTESASELLSWQSVTDSNTGTGSYSLDIPAQFTVPEPVSLSLLGGALIALGAVRRRNKKTD